EVRSHLPRRPVRGSRPDVSGAEDSARNGGPLLRSLFVRQVAVQVFRWLDSVEILAEGVTRDSLKGVPYRNKTTGTKPPSTQSAQNPQKSIGSASSADSALIVVSSIAIKEFREQRSSVEASLFLFRGRTGGRFDLFFQLRRDPVQIAKRRQLVARRHRNLIQQRPQALVGQRPVDALVAKHQTPPLLGRRVAGNLPQRIEACLRNP